MQISQFFINGDVKGAIDYMRTHEEYKDILPSYVAIFENCEYRTYERNGRKIWRTKKWITKPVLSP